MASARDYLPAGASPGERKLWLGQAQFNADNVVVVIDRANLTVPATSAAWSYTIPFHLAGGTDGEFIPYTGTITASVSDTSTAGTATIDTTTPSVAFGRGQIVLSGAAAAWLATETASCVLTYTMARSGTATKTFMLTFA